MVEYEFTLPDGTKVYEITDGPADVFRFMEWHQAIKAEPVKKDNPDSCNIIYMKG